MTPQQRNALNYVEQIAAAHKELEQAELVLSVAKERHEAALEALVTLARGTVRVQAKLEADA